MVISWTSFCYTSEMQTIFAALTLGFIGGLIPGAVLTMILVSVLQGGFRGGLKTFSYCVLAEVVIVGILLSIVLILPIPHSVFHYIGIIGGVFLLYLAYQVAQINTVTDVTMTPGSTSVLSPFRIFILSATNAPLYIFWLTVCLPLMLQLAILMKSTVFAVISFMTAFEIGWITSTFLLLLLFVKARPYLTHPIYVKYTFRVVAFVLILLAIRLMFISMSGIGLI